MLADPVDGLSADDVVAEARALIGTPFHHQGRLPGVGVDCAGVPILIARRLGLVAEDFDVGGYAPTPDGSLQAYCDAHLEPVPDPRVGGVVLVAWSVSGQVGPPQHLGVVVPYVHGGLAMVHAESRRHRRVIETRLLLSSAMRLVRAYRFKGVA